MINRLRIGLILPGEMVPAWIAKTVKNLQALPEVEIQVAVITRSDAETKWLNRLHSRIDRLFFHAGPDPEKPQNFQGMLREIPVIHGLDEEQSTRLQALKLDVLINVSIVCLPGYLLDCARYGLWTLYDGQYRVVAGSHTGWRELLSRSSLLTCAIEVTRAGQAAQIALAARMAADPYSISRNQDHLLWKASMLLPRALRSLKMDGGKQFFSNGSPAMKAVAPAQPGPAQSLQLGLTQAQNKIRKEFGKLVKLEQWALMIRPGGVSGPLGWEGFQRLVPAQDRLWADPFLVEREGRTYIFFEELVYRTKRGHINCIELDQDGSVVSNQLVLERPYHLSYPFIFRDRGQWYMLPETSQNRTIEIYRCIHFPDQWELHGILMAGICALDSTLCEHGGRWWLFTNIGDNVSPGWDALSLFYSDSPLSDHWMPHPRNPIICDVRSARPAGGLFRRGEHLFRPSQDCSHRYGYAINLNRIVTLSTTDYREVLEDRLEPPAGSNLLATHTISSTPHWTAIDANILRQK